MRKIRTAKKDKVFFAGLAVGLPVSVALTNARYTKSVAYKWRKEDETCREQWDEAIDSAVEAMEAEADRRGMEGTLKPVFYRGEECGQIREYSDTLLIFRLKALRPDKYRENLKTEHVGASGGPIA